MSAEDIYALGVEAFVYLYPLVMMDVTRRQATNIEQGKIMGRAPMNTFDHVREYPPADFHDIVRPNFDTLYSVAWLDLTKEPIVLSAPDTNGRYYLLPLLDMWTDVFAVPGKRTSGTQAGNFAIVPEHWNGRLPDGFTTITAPTPYVWLLGRTQTNGPADYEAVHKVQDAYKLTPLSQWGRKASVAPFKADPSVDMKTPPLVTVNGMPAKTFFTYAAELLKIHPPHVTDWSTIARLKRIGIEQGKSLEWDSLASEVQQALNRGATDGLKLMFAKLPTLAAVVNGWQLGTDTMGVYGNYYLKRAIVAMAGLGANQPEDAIYPLNMADADGKPLTGDQKYVLHFGKEDLPPVDAFWSLTMYDEQGFQVGNSLNRFALGDRDKLQFNPDGSLDLYIQHDSPGAQRESNWLPSPASGNLGITMRLYAPRQEALDGRWAPPAVKRVQ